MKEFESNDWVYDIELYRNFFCVNLRSFPDGEIRHTFEWSERKDERRKLYTFLATVGIRLIGFNNVGYDYVVLHYLLYDHPALTVEELWERVQQHVFIRKEKAIPWNKRKIYQIDLFKINHYDNFNRSTSLKWLEFTRRWGKVQDLPHDPLQPLPLEKFNPMIEYCWNDVDATFDFALDCQDAIRFREEMSKKFKTNMMDKSDVAIGEHINMQKYCDLTGKRRSELYNMRGTHRGEMHLADIIPSGIKFFSKEMKEWLAKLKTTSLREGDPWGYDVIISPEGKFKVVNHMAKGDEIPLQKSLYTIIRMAKGGLHSMDMAKVVECKPGHKLGEKDVGSMYPRAIVVDGVYPEHLGKEWYEGIKDSYEYRLNVLKPKLKELKKAHKKGTPEYNAVDYEQNAYKLSMNGGGFGKTGSSYSWQYDPLVMFKVTIGCQLKLLMLVEAFVLKGIEVVSVNTDGVVIHYPDEMQETVDKIHQWWEEQTDFFLEDTFYSKLVFFNVNSYLAMIVDEKGKPMYNKYKGLFDTDPEWHKNNSQRIVAIALSEYYTKGKPIKKVIGKLGTTFTNSNDQTEKTTIYDYCIGKKKTPSCEYVVVDRGVPQTIPDKVVRYYVSKGQGKLWKKYTRGKRKGVLEEVSKGFNIQMFMDFFPAAQLTTGGSYNINYAYYLNECQKIMSEIELGTAYYKGEKFFPRQLDLL